MAGISRMVGILANHFPGNTASAQQVQHNKPAMMGLNVLCRTYGARGNPDGIFYENAAPTELIPIAGR
ncbi:MAG: hypothetical protein EBV15_09755 [Bacteroidetes bacterium]|nr:hypothetical protein [Bacteroidota bacterium]